MFTLSFHVTKRHLALLGAVLVLAVAGGIWMRAAKADLKGDAPEESAGVPVSSTRIDKNPGKTNAQRIAFLESFGWKVEEEPEEIVQILIPKELDEVYTRYNLIQKEQDCDLSRYGGRLCKRYSYAVLNYPKASGNIRANLLVYDGRIIGGDICSLELDGFMHGFAISSD